MDSERRSFHKDASSIYNLPNDTPEHARLNEQAMHVSAIMDDKVLHSPIENVKDGRLLDIGCGTGYVTYTLAQQFPEAEVFGLDISPVPKREPLPPNVQFLQGNILTQAPSAWVPQDGSTTIPEDEGVFDLLFGRFVIAGISDWTAYINKQSRMLKPGGWAEIHELDPNLYNEAEETIHGNEDWVTLPAQAAEKAGLEYYCAWRARKRMEDAGFEDVSVVEYPLPVGGIGQKTPELQAAGEAFAEPYAQIREIMIKKYVKQSKEDEERMIAEMRRGMAPEPGKHNKIIVTFGRKP